MDLDGFNSLDHIAYSNVSSTGAQSNFFFERRFIHLAFVFYEHFQVWSADLSIINNCVCVLCAKVLIASKGTCVLNYKCVVTLIINPFVKWVYVLVNVNSVSSVERQQPDILVYSSLVRIAYGLFHGSAIT